jgi:hypothetical protein
VGHELGDGKYVLDQKPDLVIFSDFQSEPGFPADDEMLHDPRFAADYQPVLLDTEPPDAFRARVYVRRVDGRIGIRASGKKVDVPGYLAQADAANSVRLVDGQAQLVIPPHGAAVFAEIPLGPGQWRITAEGNGAAQVTVTGTPAGAKCAPCVDAPSPEAASISVRNNADTPATVAALELTRSGTQ